MASMQSFEAVPKEKARLHQHPGVELLYVISGKLELSEQD